MRHALALFLVVVTLVTGLAACGETIEVGPGDSCTHEGWLGPTRVCPSGYICDDKAYWTCTRYAPSPSPSSWSPSSSPDGSIVVPSPEEGDAAPEDETPDGQGDDGAAPDAGTDAVADA